MSGIDEQAKGEHEATAEALLRREPAVDESVSLIEVSERYFESSEADALAVLEGSRPLGLITRQALTRVLSARFGHALFGRDPIASVADREALILPADASLESCLKLAFERSARRAYDDLVIVRPSGEYAGTISVKELVLHQTDRLAHERGRRVEALARSERLEEVAAMKSRFLAAVTHELRAPINTIAGLAELLETYVELGRVERVPGHVRTLRATVAHLRALVDNVLEQAKLEAGKLSVARERIDSCALIREMAESIRILARPSVAVKVETPSAPVWVESDPVKVRQIVMNLGSNAAKFTEAGAITLRVTPLPRGAELAVLDTGPGIAEHLVPMLFEPFTQLQEVETRRHGGTGLGLAISRQLAELLGGGLRVETRLGSGTAMHLRLPNALTEQSSGES